MIYTFRKALSSEADVIATMVNHAYRGEHSKLGWTTEAHLLEGLRTTAEELLVLMNTPQSMILLCHCNAELVGSVHMEKHADTAYFGMLVVRPALQAQGIGKQLLEAAEREAKMQWGVTKSAMCVISTRHELLEFYQRRGYTWTGELKRFPVNPAMWQPKVPNLQLALLEKQLQ